MRHWKPLLGIILITGSLALAFAWTAGWTGDRVTTRTFLGDALKTGVPGFRRAHSKGICYAGTFRPGPGHEAASISVARVFTQHKVPVVGRFSIASNNPYAADSSTDTVSMALMLTTDDGQQWRIAMNTQPFFPTHNPEGFLAQRIAFRPNPDSGQPDPARIAAFYEEYPEARKFSEWTDKAPLTRSFAGVEYFGVHAFLFVGPDGREQPVRWSFRSHLPFMAISRDERKQLSPDFLFDDLRQRIGQGPLNWDMVLQLAKPGDPYQDPSEPWPEDRQRIVAGTVEVTRVFEQSDGACRDINYDPSIIPLGIRVSGDLVLNARSGVYSHSFNQRMRETGYGRTAAAVGKIKREGTNDASSPD